MLLGVTIEFYGDRGYGDLFGSGNLFHTYCRPGYVGSDLTEYLLSWKVPFIKVVSRTEHLFFRNETIALLTPTPHKSKWSHFIIMLRILDNKTINFWSEK